MQHFCLSQWSGWTITVAKIERLATQWVWPWPISTHDTAWSRDKKLSVVSSGKSLHAHTHTSWLWEVAFSLFHLTAAVLFLLQCLHTCVITLLCRLIGQHQASCRRRCQNRQKKMYRYIVTMLQYICSLSPTLKTGTTKSSKCKCSSTLILS